MHMHMHVRTELRQLSGVAALLRYPLAETDEPLPAPLARARAFAHARAGAAP